VNLDRALLTNPPCLALSPGRGATPKAGRHAPPHVAQPLLSGEFPTWTQRNVRSVEAQSLYLNFTLGGPAPVVAPVTARYAKTTTDGAFIGLPANAAWSKSEITRTGIRLPRRPAERLATSSIQKKDVLAILCRREFGLGRSPACPAKSAAPLSISEPTMTITVSPLWSDGYAKPATCPGMRSNEGRQAGSKPPRSSLRTSAKGLLSRPRRIFGSQP